VAKAVNTGRELRKTSGFGKLIRPRYETSSGPAAIAQRCWSAAGLPGCWGSYAL